MAKVKKCRVRQNPNCTPKEMETALKKIAMMGYGMKDEVRDWANIGRNAVVVALGALAGTCRGCGRGQIFDPKIHAREDNNND